MAKGVKKVFINPSSNKGGTDFTFEGLLPESIEFRNGDITPFGNWTRRYGHEEAYLTGIASPVSLLINVSPGYAVLENGDIYKLDTLSKLTTPMRGIRANLEYHPQYAVHKDMIIIVDGHKPVKIQNGDSAYLGGNPPKAKFIARLGQYIILAGYEDEDGEFTEYRWCAAGNPEEWDAGDSGFDSVRPDSLSGIKAMIVNGAYLYFFKEFNTEVWALVGGDAMFARHEAACFDVGISSPYSLVKSINSLVWLGNTNDIYELAGGSTTIISSKYKQILTELNHPETLFGLDFGREYKIRWFASQDGKCLVYDYLNKAWSEDNIWDGNSFQRMPFNSQMYFNEECYVGSSLPDGKIYRFAKDIATDNGQAINVVRKFQVIPWLEGDIRGTLNKVVFRAKRGVGNAAESSPQFAVRVRADKGEWQSDYLSLGVASDKNPNIEIYPRLYGHEYEFEIIETDAVDYLVTDMQIFFEGNQ